MSHIIIVMKNSGYKIDLRIRRLKVTIFCPFLSADGAVYVTLLIKLPNSRCLMKIKNFSYFIFELENSFLTIIDKTYFKNEGQSQLIRILCQSEFQNFAMKLVKLINALPSGHTYFYSLFVMSDSK